MRSALLGTFLFFGLNCLAGLDRFTYQTGAGISFYQGDIGEAFPVTESIRYNVKGGVNFRLYKFLGIHYHISYTQIHHSDLYSDQADRQDRGIFFENKILHSGIHLSLNQFISPYTKIIHYIYLGLDAAAMQVTTEKRGGTRVLAPEGTFSPFQILGPIGAGLGYRVSKRIGIVSEFTYYLSNTDYLDGTSYNGTPANTDSFVNYNLMVTIKLGKLKRARRPSFNSRRYRFNLFEIPAVYDWN